MPELKELVKNQVLWYSVFSKTNDVTRNEPATQWSAHGTASMMQWQNHSPLSLKLLDQFSETTFRLTHVK